MTDDPNFYDDDVDRFDQTTDQPAYTPAAVNKSNSLTSNECTRSSFDGPTSANTIQPLKLVFKRQSDNNYEIKNQNNLLLDDNNNQLSNDAWSTASDLPAENDLKNGNKRRPMRQSARKVKFIFSDAEEDQEADFLPPTNKKKRSHKNKSLTNNIINSQNFSTQQLLMPQIFSQFQKLNESDHSSDGDDEDQPENTLQIYQELLLKNMPQAQMLSLQNMVLQNQLQNQYLLNAKMSVEQSLAAKEKRSRKKSSRIVQENITETVKPRGVVKKKPSSKPRINSKNINQKKPDVAPPPAAPPIKKIRQAPETTFTRDEIYKASFLEKLEIMKLKPYVALYHSQGIPIALVENKTNFIQTKAVLFLHLFVSLSAGCIWCPLCADHLSITEFSRHVHPEEGDDEEEDHPAMTNNEAKAEKTYKVLPYRIDNSQELSSDVLATWKAFAKRFSEFKQAQANKTASSADVDKKQKEMSETSSQKTKEPAKVQAQKDTNQKLESENSPALSPPPSPQSIRNLEKFNDWDYEDNERFLITSDRLAADQIYEVHTDRLQEEIHYFMEQEEDLLLSEDESDDKSELTEESEARFNQTKSLSQAVTTINQSTDYNNIEPLLNDMVNHVVDSLSFQKVKQQLRTKRLSYDESTVEMSCTKPSLLERYFNLYDNLTTDVLLYICDNEFTVIPDSYVLYINNKRAIAANELKLARSDRYQREWLQLSLDLECSSKTRGF